MMEKVSHKIRYGIVGAVIVPCFGRLALQGTGHEHDYFRFIIPLFIGSLSGYLVGLMKDRWLSIHADLKKTNYLLAKRIDAHLRTEEALRESEERYRILFKNHDSVMLLIDSQTAKIVDANPAAVTFYGWDLDALTGMKISQINTLPEQEVFQAMQDVFKGPRRDFVFQHRLACGDLRDVEVFCGPIVLHGRELIYSIIHDITDRTRAERQREKLIEKLQGALREIKTLRGIIPICSNCKNIRNDEGAWSKLEEYISDNSNAEFSHGLCPDCAKQLYPELY